MYNRRLIYFSAHQVTVFVWKAGILNHEDSFENTADGLNRFTAYLATHRRSIFSILADVSEESFQIETIPFLHGKDRSAIIARKCGQLFFNASLTTSVSLGHQKSRRKDERIMLAALTNNDAFSPWLAAITDADVPLRGLYSLPLLAPLLLKTIGVTDKRCLLLTIQDQGLRQSYLENGELQFSRLTPLHNSSIGGIAQTFSNEAHKLQQYLVSQRIIGRHESIGAYLLAHANARKAIENSSENSETLSFVILDIEESARRCGCNTPPVDTRCEQLFLQLLAKNARGAQFAGDDIRRGYYLWRIRTLLQGSGALILGACLLTSGKLAFDAYRLQQETAFVTAETDLARRRYDSIVKTFPSIPTDNDSLRRVIRQYANLERESILPDGLFREISRALQSSEAVEIENIEWKSVDENAPPRKPLATPAKVNPPSTPNIVNEVAIFSGTLRLSAETPPRQVLVVFNRFIDALKRNAKLDIDVLQQPFDVESGKSLKGWGNALIDETQSRAFKVRISRPLGP